MTRLLLLLPLLLACRHKCPVAPTPAPTPYLIHSPTCDLPSLPDAPTVNVGFPTPTEILVSRTDYAQMLVFVAGLRDWIAAAEGCMKAQR